MPPKKPTSKGFNGKPRKHDPFGVHKLLEQNGFNAVEEFMKAYKKLDTPSEQVQTMLEFFKFLYPKVKDMTLPMEIPDDPIQQIEEIETQDLLEELNPIPVKEDVIKLYKE